MQNDQSFEIFLTSPPGLEKAVKKEAKSKDFKDLRITPGGVVFNGTWNDVWRANLQLRGPSRILARIGQFRVVHLSQLDKTARNFPWSDFLKPNIPVRVDVTCRKSKIYHAKAAAQRIETALKEEMGIAIDQDADLKIRARIDDNVCTLSIDTSGELLHKRGHKVAVNKAPMRENLAYLMLSQCGYQGNETVLDPMCGSGTFVIEAAEVANGLLPGRSRRFAFEYLKSFDEKKWNSLKSDQSASNSQINHFGFDRDVGAINMSIANAERAGVEASTEFSDVPISDLQRPEGSPGLLMANAPYGARIGSKKPLLDLYSKFGQVVTNRFQGWRIGLITNEPELAEATKLNFNNVGPIIDHGGIKIRLYQAYLRA